MKQARAAWIIISGWLLFLVATVLFIGQMGFLLLHDKVRVAYIDDRLFYLFNILFALTMCMALFLLFSFTKKSMLFIGLLVVIFLAPHVWLLWAEEKTDTIITSVSPDFRQVFAVKGDPALAEATYYRSYFRVLGRPKVALSDMSADAYDITWLENDIAVLTYETRNGDIQQFVGTYGDRGTGYSYYNVGPEMQGVWTGEQAEVVSSPDGIEVTVNHETETFTWDEQEQFGTLAIVLKKDGCAAWTIALDTNFRVYADAMREKTGNIILYEATLEEHEPYILQYKQPYQQ